MLTSTASRSFSHIIIITIIPTENFRKEPLVNIDKQSGKRKRGFLKHLLGVDPLNRNNDKLSANK